MTTIITPSSLALVPSLETAWQDVDSSFERFGLTVGIGAIEQMLCEDAQQWTNWSPTQGQMRLPMCFQEDRCRPCDCRKPRRWANSATFMQTEADSGRFMSGGRDPLGSPMAILFSRRGQRTSSVLVRR